MFGLARLNDYIIDPRLSASRLGLRRATHFGYETPLLLVRRLDDRGFLVEQKATSFDRTRAASCGSSPPNPSAHYTAVENLATLAHILDRKVRHIANYFGQELKLAVCWDFTNRRLIIDDGQLTEERLQIVLANFIRKFVACALCDATRTDLRIDPYRANVFVECRECFSQYSLLNQTLNLTSCEFLSRH
jgi:translation initiation factor 2 beta subunit (eIF-2beta)/eIF-5